MSVKREKNIIKQLAFKKEIRTSLPLPTSVNEGLKGQPRSPCPTKTNIWLELLFCSWIVVLLPTLVKLKWKFKWPPAVCGVSQTHIWLLSVPASLIWPAQRHFSLLFQNQNFFFLSPPTATQGPTANPKVATLSSQSKLVKRRSWGGREERGTLSDVSVFSALSLSGWLSSYGGQIMRLLPFFLFSFSPLWTVCQDSSVISWRCPLAPLRRGCTSAPEAPEWRQWGHRLKACDTSRLWKQQYVPHEKNAKMYFKKTAVKSK